MEQTECHIQLSSHPKRIALVMFLRNGILSIYFRFESLLLERNLILPVGGRSRVIYHLAFWISACQHKLRQQAGYFHWRLFIVHELVFLLAQYQPSTGIVRERDKKAWIPPNQTQWRRYRGESTERGIIRVIAPSDWIRKLRVRCSSFMGISIGAPNRFFLRTNVRDYQEQTSVR